MCHQSQLTLQVPDFEVAERKRLQQGCATTLVAALDPALEGHYISEV
jgi:hypothetical protein